MTIVFWASVALVLYVYAGYPVLLRVWALCRRSASRPPAPAAATSSSPVPSVSIVVAARNEGARLGARIDNLLALDYPGARQIIVVSDGSTDDTATVVRRYGRQAELVEVPAGGKAQALNAGVARARGELLVFADARQAFAPDALCELVKPFVDPQIGGVSGELLLDCESALFSNRRASADRRRGHAGQLHGVAGERRASRDRRRTVLSTIADGVGMYWHYEKELRRLESAVGSMLGATGAIYAIRRTFWRPLPPAAILDDVLTPMRVVLSRARVVFNEKARAFDRAAVDADAESRRKVRTLAGNYQILWLEPRLLLPWRNPVWLQYVSHKLGRLAVPYAWMAIFVTNVALFSQHLIYQAALVGQVAFMLLAGYGALLELRGRAGMRVQPAAAQQAVSGSPAPPSRSRRAAPEVA